MKPRAGSPADAAPSPAVAAATDSDVLSVTATRNLAVAMSLRATAWALAEAGLRSFRPELSEAEVQAAVRSQFRRSTG